MNGRKMNRGYTYRERLGDAADGLGLLEYLSSQYAHSTRRQWRDRIEQGRVLVESVTGRPENPVLRAQLAKGRPDMAAFDVRDIRADDHHRARR